MKYRRVAQRLKEKFRSDKFLKTDLEDAIFVEIGTDKRTIDGATDKLIRLKLIEKVSEPREFGVMPTEKYTLSLSQDDLF